MALELDLNQFRILAGLEDAGPRLRESSPSPQRPERRRRLRDPDELIEYELGLRDKPPSYQRPKKRQVEKKAKPSYRDLYEENQALKREVASLRAANQRLEETVTYGRAGAYGPSGGFSESSVAPWDMGGGRNRFARVRASDELQAFLEDTGEELTRGSLSRAPRKRPPPPPPDAVFTSASVRPETMGPPPSLFQSMDAFDDVSEELETVSRWESLDTDEGLEIPHEEALPSPRFASCIDEAGDALEALSRDLESSPRFEGILDE